MRCQNPVVLFLVDSLRPDGLEQAETPYMDQLIAEGACTMSAQTVVPSTTLPCIVSLFFSVEPNVHGITTNTWSPLDHMVPGLFEVVSQSGLRSAAFFNWDQLCHLHPPGSLEAMLFLRDDETPKNGSDRELATLAEDYFRKHQVDFAFVYFHQTDAAGHRDGWMSAPYIDAIAEADHSIGKILNTLPPQTVLMITADHGGINHQHGADSPEETTIPFIIKGPGIPRGRRLKQPLRITDIAPTIAYFLGIESPTEWIGRAVKF